MKRVCFSCDTLTKTEKFENLGTTKPIYLCDLCANTGIGNAATSIIPTHPYATPRMVAQAIHWLRKEIRKEIQKGKKK